MQPVGQRDTVNIILQHVDKASLSNFPRVCTLWNQVYQAHKENLTRSILPIGKSDLKILLGQGVTESLLQRFIQDPRALTKIYCFFQSYFTDIPEDQRLFSQNSEKAITHTGALTRNRLFQHSNAWRPYATAMAILFSCNVNMQYIEQEGDRVNQRPVMYPCFTATESEEEGSDDESVPEDRNLAVDWDNANAQALLTTSLCTQHSRFYLTFDHQKHPTCFTQLHSSIISTFDPMMRALSDQVATVATNTDKGTVLKCMQTALAALGNKADHYAFATIAKKYSDIAEEDQSYEYYLQAAELYETANTRCIEEHTIWCQSRSNAPTTTGGYAAQGAKIGLYHYKAGIAYYNAARLASTEEEQQSIFLKAATHFAMNLSHNEKESSDSTYSEYRYAGSAHYYIGDYQKAKIYYIEAKKRKNEPDIDARLEAIEQKLSGLQRDK